MENVAGITSHVVKLKWNRAGHVIRLKTQDGHVNYSSGKQEQTGVAEEDDRPTGYMTYE